MFTIGLQRGTNHNTPFPKDKAQYRKKRDAATKKQRELEGMRDVHRRAAAALHQGAPGAPAGGVLGGVAQGAHRIPTETRLVLVNHVEEMRRCVEEVGVYLPRERRSYISTCSDQSRTLTTLANGLSEMAELEGAPRRREFLGRVAALRALARERSRLSNACAAWPEPAALPPVPPVLR